MQIQAVKSATVAASIIILCLSAAYASDPTTSASRPAWLDSPEVAAAQTVSVVVFLTSDQVQSKVFKAAQAADVTRVDRIKTVTNDLRTFRPVGYDRISQYLNQCSTSPVIAHWIVPAFSATLTPAEVETIAAMPGVKMVVQDIALESIAPVDEQPAPSLASGASSSLQLLNVPALWSLGYTGKGRLICSLDTGVDGDHPALHNRWRGNTSALSAAWFSTINPDSLPYDNVGHGTHTMGTMVGIDGSDTIGVAPGAEWIAAGVVDQGKSLSATITDILQAFEWTLNPDGDWNTTDDVPDVVLNSWGIPAGIFGPCDETFWEAIDNVEAAGIVAIFSAGNEGPAAESLRNPANRASSPTNAFAVGAVDGNKIIANFSSRGPSVCDTASIKPEVVAPGVSIRSSTKDGGYKYMSGTSMAAPYIAGLVALCRQYNPDATVEQIKWALMKSAEDLGDEGEDNAYGYGLVDASRLPEFLPSPNRPVFSVAASGIAGDGTAMPNEQAQINVTLTTVSANVSHITGVLTSRVTGVTVISGRSDFFFGGGGSTAVNSAAFDVFLSGDLMNGQNVDFRLELLDTLELPLDTVTFSLTVGYAVPGVIADHNAGTITVSVSDFGQFGFARGSIYDAGGSGFRYANGQNLLYEGGIVIGRSGLQLASAVRDSNGAFRPSDFAPVQSLGSLWAEVDLSLHRSASLQDEKASVSLPIVVEQETVDFAAVEDEGIVIIKYRLINPTAERLSNVHFGFLADFDLPNGERVSYDPASGLVSQYNDQGQAVGIRLLANLSSVTTLDNGAAKVGLTGDDMFRILSSTGNVDPQLAGDLFVIVSSQAISLEPRGSIEIAFALLAAANAQGLADRSDRAAELYGLPTGVDDNPGTLPNSFRLCQNYPNPFNPSTTISFNVPASANVTLEVYNTLGQRVKVLVNGQMPAGEHQVEWIGTNDAGNQVASGVYFYRLSTEERSETRKMVLLQ